MHKKPDLPSDYVERDINISAQQYQQALEAVGAGTWSLDVLNGLVYLDRFSQQLFGLYPSGPLPFYRLFKNVYAHDRRRVKKELTRVLDRYTKRTARRPRPLTGFTQTQNKKNQPFQLHCKIVNVKEDKVTCICIKGSAILDTNNTLIHFSGIVQEITDREHNQATHLSERITHAAVENSESGYFYLDLQKNELEYSAGFSKILTGIEQADLKADAIQKHIYHADRAIRAKALIEAKRSGKLHYEARAIWEDGSIHWFRVKGEYLIDEIENFPYTTGTIYDTTHEHLHQLKVKEAEEKFKSVTGSAPCGLWLSDEKGNFTYLNNTLLNWTDIPYEFLLGDGWSNIIIPEDRTKSKTAFQQAVSRRSHYEITFRIKNKQNKIIWCKAAGDPYYNNEGEYAGYAGYCMDINELLEGRDALRVSEEKFRTVIEEAPIATCLLVGKKLNIEVANEIMLGYWGKDKSVLGKPLQEVVPELFGKQILDILQNVFNTGETYIKRACREELLINGKPTIFYFDYTYKALRDAQNKVYAIMNMAVDVTEQINARKEQEETEFFTHTIIDDSPVAKVVLIGSDFIIRTINKNMLELLEKDNTIIGNPFWKVVSNEFFEINKEKLQLVLTSGGTCHQSEQKMSVTKEGITTTHYYNYIYKALKKTSGEIYGVMATAVDVTEQVLARQKVEEAESTLRGAVEVAELGTWQLDLETGLIECSPRLREWFGFDETATITLEMANKRILKKDLKRVNDSLELSIPHSVNGIFDVEYVIDHPFNGKKRIVHSQGKPIADKTGKVYRIGGFVQDVTVQKKHQHHLEQQVLQRTKELGIANEELTSVNAELAESNRLLMHSNEELAQYAYVASHDLQEPLRKIRMFSSVLREYKEMPEKSALMVEKINESSVRMSLLIESLLEYSSLLKTDALISAVDLNNIAREVISDFELTIEEKQAVILLDTLPVITGIALQMNQLFYNLISNALKFSHPDLTPEIRIKYRTIAQNELQSRSFKSLKEDSYHYITVTDNGIGFETEFAEQIFEVFKRLHGRKKYPGSGIGLALCKRIIENHKGMLFATSEKDSGTTFNILLPMSNR